MILEQTPPLIEGRALKNFPAKLSILGQPWRIGWCNLQTARGALGCTINEQRLILLDNEQSKESAQSVLLHEILHAILGDSSLWSLPQDTEEAIVRTLCPGLMSVLRGNRSWWT